MKALILDGSHAGDPMSAKVTAALLANVQARGWEAETIVLREQKIGNCAGCFFCWVRSPGLCTTNDDNRVIAAKIVQSDLAIYLTPVTFGGYSSALKCMVDHQIQNILPFFVTIGGEIHHQQRYGHYPNALVIGWMDTPDAAAEAVFRHLVKRNAINMYARTSVCGLAIGNPPEPELVAQTEAWLEAIVRRTDSPMPALPVTSSALVDAEPVRRAVLLVGSPRTNKSTSASLGSYLMAQLAARGIAVETIQIYTSFNAADRTRAALEVLDSADLAVLAFPLYVDSLPAPVVAALEKIALHRAKRSTHQRFAVIANSGFPEASHNATALAICAEFARQSGFVWAGGLALGGGEGLVHGRPLDELDGRAIPIKRSLALAAAALADGQCIPQAARDLLARPAVPKWLYRLLGGYGWKQQAKRYGMNKNLNRRPYEVIESETYV
jgi:multimeric flavodoxin WrbA